MTVFYELVFDSGELGGSHFDIWVRNDLISIKQPKQHEQIWQKFETELQRGQEWFSGPSVGETQRRAPILYCFPIALAYRAWFLRRDFYGVISTAWFLLRDLYSVIPPAWFLRRDSSCVTLYKFRLGTREIRGQPHSATCVVLWFELPYLRSYTGYDAHFVTAIATLFS